MHRVRAVQCEDKTIEPDRKTDKVGPRAGAGAQEFQIVGAEDKQLIDRPEAMRRPRSWLKTERPITPLGFIEKIADIDHDMVEPGDRHRFLSCAIDDRVNCGMIAIQRAVQESG